MLSEKCVVLGVTGGIAAYKSTHLASLLTKQGIDTRVIMTKNACEFVAPLTFTTLTKHPVCVDTFTHGEWEIEHIALAQRADVFVVAPATANIIGKYAHGIADDMLSTTLLATRAPVIFAPAMNTAMWEHAAVRANIDTLVSRGVEMIGPDSGLLACGDVGAGRMSEPEEIFEAIMCALTVKDFSGKRVAVTAGPTREAVDPVRYITNRSSGKMGYAIARAAHMRGAVVTLYTGPVALDAPYGVSTVNVTTTRELYDCLIADAQAFDVIIQSAAPCDFAPETAEQKIKREGDAPLNITMYPNPDIAQKLGEIKPPGQVLVAFAAETQDLADNALKKLTKKRADFIVANDVTQPGAGFDGDTNQAIIISKRGVEQLPMMTKTDMAHAILDRVAQCTAT